MLRIKQQGFGTPEVLFITILIAAISGVGFYVYNHKHSTIQQSSISNHSNIANPKNKIVSSATRSTISTKDWQSHGEAMFIIKFPKSWSFFGQGDKFTAPDGTSQESIESQFVPTGEQPNQGKVLGMEEVDNTKLLTAAQFAEKNPLAQGQVVSKTSFKANGNDAYMEIDGGISNSSETNRVIIVNDKFPIAIIFHYDSVSSYTKTFEQMFQTIKFQNSCHSAVGC